MNFQKLLLLLTLTYACTLSAQKFDPKNYTSADLRVEHIGVLENIKPKKVFRYVTDHSQLQNWAPGGITVTHLDNTNAKKEGGVGCIRTCSIKGYGEVKEEIVFKDKPKIFAYSMLDNNMFGYSNHLMVIKFDETDEGTRITWNLYFDHKQADQAAAQMERAFSAAMEKIQVAIEANL